MRKNEPNRTKSTNNFLRKFGTSKPRTRYQALCKVMSAFDLSSPPCNFFVTCRSQRNCFLRQSMRHRKPHSSQKHTSVITWWRSKNSLNLSSSSVMAAKSRKASEHPRHDIFTYRVNYSTLHGKLTRKSRQTLTADSLTHNV